MKKIIKLVLLMAMVWLPAHAENVQITSPDGKLVVEVSNPRNGRAYYSVSYVGDITFRSEC